MYEGSGDPTSCVVEFRRSLSIEVDMEAGKYLAKASRLGGLTYKTVAISLDAI